MRKNLENLNSPATWSNNPKLAKQLFETTVGLLHKEMETYREALTSKSAYRSKNLPSASEIKNPPVTQEQVANSPLTVQSAQSQNMANAGIGQIGAVNHPTAPQGSMIQVITPDGKTWSIPAGKLKDALSRGARQVNNG